MSKRKSSTLPCSEDGDCSQAAPTNERQTVVGGTGIHRVAAPRDYVSTKEETLHGTLCDPAYHGTMAKTYPFALDSFQRLSVACLERNESLMVSAHTSAGKTVVAEYAIAMAFRDKQRVIFTSPLKALSNQKYRELNQEFGDVGLLTGDLKISPAASCLVVTTEILRAMLYRGSHVVQEAAWVVFDEIHYMNDKDRGTVWEESIMLLPPAVKMVFLSATLSNALEFVQWVAELRRQPCHVVFTDLRPVPLRHYVFRSGGSGLHVAVDDKGQFREDNFRKLQHDGCGGRGNRGADLHRILKMIMERKFQPVIIFSFSRRDCEKYAVSVSKLNFNSEEEEADVEHIFQNAIQCLNEEDRTLPAVELMLPLLRRGIAIHHSGLLPIIKELVELLVQEGLIKALFATETFAMGLNMPTKTVVFTELWKWDGNNHRWMSSGEYIQMSGRAGRRGKDERGICIVMVDEQMDMEKCKEMILGKHAPLISTFRLSYYMLLNLVSQAEGQFDAEYIIENSFFQFQHKKAQAEIKETLLKLEKEAAMLDSFGCAGLSEYHKLKLNILQLKEQLMDVIIQSEKVISVIVPGRLVKVRHGGIEWGWGVIANVVKKPLVAHGALSSISLVSSHDGCYIVDILLHCAPGLTSDGPRPLPRPCHAGEKGEMHVVPIQLPFICALSSLKVTIPLDLRPIEARQRIFMEVQELEKHFPEGLPKLDLIKDSGLDDPELLKIVDRITEDEQKLVAHPFNKSELDGAFQRKEELHKEAERLRMKMHESKLHKFREELNNRSRVLIRLGHIDADGVVQLKGRAACLIDMADELLVTELMFNGVFYELDLHQLVAVASCFILGDKSSELKSLRKELVWPLHQIQVHARRIAEVQCECNLDIDVEDYIESTILPYLMDAIYCWSKGTKFSEICEMTDVFEGSIIRIIRRLDEFLNQLKIVACTIGDEQLEKKFNASSESLRRGIIFANSLYL